MAMLITMKISKRERIKRTIKHFIYVVKSYLKLEPCGYCGKLNDPEAICYKCLTRHKRWERN